MTKADLIFRTILVAGLMSLTGLAIPAGAAAQPETDGQIFARDGVGAMIATRPGGLRPEDEGGMAAPDAGGYVGMAASPASQPRQSIDRSEPGQSQSTTGRIEALIESYPGGLRPERDGGMAAPDAGGAW